MNIYYIFIVLNGYDEDYGALVIANSAKKHLQLHVLNY